MSDLSRNITYHEEGFVVVKDRDLNIQPLACPVCAYFMKSSMDTYYWNHYECCEECGITWAEGPNKRKWKKGWRPAEEDILSEVQRRAKMIPRLKL